MGKGEWVASTSRGDRATARRRPEDTPTRPLGDEEQRKRFAREGQALSSLSHKNLIMFYRLGIWQNLYPYIAMEFLSGKSLLEEIQQTGPLEPRRALELMIQVCEGMEHAHRAGIIHRDLKPGNLMLVDKEVGLLKVVDFGLARLNGSATKQGLTQTGALIGSIHYMSPDQRRLADEPERLKK